MNWTRRDFIRASSAGALAGAFGVPVGLSASPKKTGPPTYQEFRELRRGVGRFSARGGTIGWLVNSDGCVVVDSQFPDTAEECVSGLGDRTEFPIDALLNTHHHGDHTAGNGVFSPVAETIVAHARVPELQRQAAQEGSEQTYADQTYEDEWALEVGDESVHARYYGPAHTGGDSVIRFQEADVVHMGDLVFNRLHPFVDRPGGAHVQGWIDLLEAVTDDTDSGTLFIFGHGRPEFGVIGSREEVLYQRDYLSALLEAAETAHREGRSREEVAFLDVLPAFPDHEDVSANITLGAALGAAYDEVAARE